MILDNNLDSIKRIGTGLSFIFFPLVFVFAFAGHPNLINFHFLSPEELIFRARGNEMLHLGHALVTINTGLLVVAAIHFMKLLEKTSFARAGFIGCVFAVLGALMLAADKGALCLTMSALETIPDDEFSNAMPALLAMFSKEGWLVLIWGLLFLPIGFTIQAIALLKTNTLPRWQAVLFLIGILFIGIPDGVEFINLSAALLMSIAFVPYGFSLLTKN
jgi:hypothetical protein